MFHLTPLAGKTDPHVSSAVENFNYNNPDWRIHDGEYEAIFKVTGEIPHGPAYGHLTINRNNETIWQANNCAADSFNANMLSAKYAKAVVSYWPNGMEPNTQTVQVIDLTNGHPALTLPRGSYYNTGHCQSFDALYYATGSIPNTMCRHLQTGLEFNILQNIRSQLHKVKT